MYSLQFICLFWLLAVDLCMFQLLYFSYKTLGKWCFNIASKYRQILSLELLYTKKKSHRYRNIYGYVREWEVYIILSIKILL